jgi:Skp family chaperone for outer membrane proteins
MKTTSEQTKPFKTEQAYLLSLIMAASLALGLIGCASAGYQKGSKTGANILDAANRIAAMPARIDQTVAALNELVENPQSDLRPQFKAFSAQLADMESDAQDIAAARRSMAANGKEFFAMWDEQLAQIQNEDIKTRSQSRKEEVAQKLQTVKESYAEAATSFKPFLAELKDVQKALSVDLTAGGVAAMQGTAAKATRDAGPLKDSAFKLAAEFKTLGLAMSSVTPAAN